MTYPLNTRPGAGAAERAMVEAENACRVPLDPTVTVEEAAQRGMGEAVRRDGPRFAVLEHCKAAMAALDDVSRFDRVTHDLVREKIGRAQRRAGWQGGGE